MLAGLLGWPQATFAAKLEVAASKKEVTVERETDTGTQTLQLVSAAQYPWVIDYVVRLRTLCFT
jgi:electron transfer flavoprotein beta subunit